MLELTAVLAECKTGEVGYGGVEWALVLSGAGTAFLVTILMGEGMDSSPAKSVVNGKKQEGEMLSPDAYVCRRRVPGCLALELGLGLLRHVVKRRKREC